jgi:hypothetical protein
VVPEGLEVDVAALLREYAAADEQQKEAAARRGELRAAIEEYLDQCQAQRIEGGGYVAERRAVKRVSSWDVDRLRKLLEPLGLWDNVTQVNTTAVRRLLSSQDLSWEEKRSVEAAAEHSESKQLRVKPLSRGEEGEDTEE